jgi:hypothetical protein
MVMTESPTGIDVRGKIEASREKSAFNAVFSIGFTARTSDSPALPRTFAIMRRVAAIGKSSVFA